MIYSRLLEFQVTSRLPEGRCRMSLVVWLGRLYLLSGVRFWKTVKSLKIKSSSLLPRLNAAVITTSLVQHKLVIQYW